jgi:hypothetical protein
MKSEHMSQLSWVMARTAPLYAPEMKAALAAVVATVEVSCMGAAGPVRMCEPAPVLLPVSSGCVAVPGWDPAVLVTPAAVQQAIQVQRREMIGGAGKAKTCQQAWVPVLLHPGRWLCAAGLGSYWAVLTAPAQQLVWHCCSWVASRGMRRCAQSLCKGSAGCTCPPSVTR